MKPAAVLASLVVLSACNAANPVREPPPAPFTGTKWLLITERKMTGEPPYLEFGDGAVTGYSGCNRIIGRYIQDSVGAGAIVFSTVSASKRMCENHLMAIEERLLSVLRSSTSLRILGDSMRIDGSAGSLNFQAEVAAPAAAPAR